MLGELATHPLELQAKNSLRTSSILTKFGYNLQWRACRWATHRSSSRNHGSSAVLRPFLVQHSHGRPQQRVATEFFEWITAFRNVETLVYYITCTYILDQITLPLYFTVFCVYHANRCVHVIHLFIAVKNSC